MLKTRSFLTVLTGAMLMAIAVSCNGNGGASDSEGEIYTGGGVHFPAAARRPEAPLEAELPAPLRRATS